MLSIIIPVRNSRAFITECVESIFLQRGVDVPFEVIVSDNGSTDDTWEVLSAALRRIDGAAGRTRLFRQEQDLGAYGNLNFLLEKCRFSHAHILCADDTFSGRDSLSEILRAITAFPEASLFAFDNSTHHAEGQHWRLIEKYLGEGVIGPEDFVKLLFSFGCFLGGLSNVCINRSGIGSATRFNSNERYSADNSFYAQVALEGGSLVLVRKVVTIRRHHDQSISSTANAGNLTSHESIATTDRLFGRLCETGCHRAILRFYASWQIAQFYHGGFRQLLLHRKTDSIRRVIAAQRGRPAFYPPLISILLAIAIWPKVYRTKLHMAKERWFIRALLNKPSQ